MLDPPPQHLAHTQRHGTSIEVWIGLIHKLPIALGPEVFKPSEPLLSRLAPRRCRLLRSKSTLIVGIFGQAARNHLIRKNLSHRR